MTWETDKQQLTATAQALREREALQEAATRLACRTAWTRPEVEAALRYMVLREFSLDEAVATLEKFVPIFGSANPMGFALSAVEVRDFTRHSIAAWSGREHDPAQPLPHAQFRMRGKI